MRHSARATSLLPTLTPRDAEPAEISAMTTGFLGQWAIQNLSTPQPTYWNFGISNWFTTRVGCGMRSSDSRLVFHKTHVIRLTGQLLEFPCRYPSQHTVEIRKTYGLDSPEIFIPSLNSVASGWWGKRCSQKPRLLLLQACAHEEIEHRPPIK